MLINPHIIKARALIFHVLDQSLALSRQIQFGIAKTIINKKLILIDSKSIIYI